MAEGPRCGACGAGWADGRPEFRATCPACGAWVHACRNCRHHDPAVHHECRASATAEYVADKEKFNFCEEFVFAQPGSGAPKRSRGDAEKLFPDLP